MRKACPLMTNSLDFHLADFLLVFICCLYGHLEYHFLIEEVHFICNWKVLSPSQKYHLVPVPPSPQKTSDVMDVDPTLRARVEAPKNWTSGFLFGWMRSKANDQAEGEFWARVSHWWVWLWAR